VKSVFIILNGFSFLAILSFTSLFFKKTVTYSNFLQYLLFYFFILYEVEFITSVASVNVNFFLLELIFPGVAFDKAMEEINYNNFLNINSLKTFFSNMYLIRYAVFIIIFTIFFLSLTIFLENKFAEENQSSGGFNLKNLFKKKSKNSFDHRSNDERYNEDIEPMETNEKCMVEVCNIQKIFDNDFCAVNDVSFKVYENEIFGILGHNGAGKSTLINIMTGLINPNRGEIYYNGEDFFKNKINIRKDFGICPQNCSLFEYLTVEQNINIFAKIKEIEVDVDEILNEIELSSKKDEKVALLSGGQKKKLNIVIALMGNPKYVFLDEPTTGLDPLSRRKVWDLLKEKKNGKVIFLTTHYMDEADILTDRKLILHHGVIRCLGTSMFLKKHFNIMYNLKIETEHLDEATQIIKSHIPEAIEQSEENSNVILNSNDNNNNENKYKQVYTFKLPTTSSPHLSKLINELEKCVESQDIITNFSISLPSLEELFIKLSLEKEQKAINSGNTNKYSSNNDDGTTILIDKESLLPKYEELSKPSDSTIISSLASFKFKYYLKNKSFFMYSIGIPIIISLLLFILIRVLTRRKFNVFEPKEISFNSMYGDTVWNYNTNESNVNVDILKYGFGQNVNMYDNQTLGDMIQKMNPDDKLYSVSLIGNNNDLNYSFNVNYNKTMPYTPPASLNAITNSILHSKGINEQVKVFTQPFDYVNNSNDIISNMIACYCVGFIVVLGLFCYGTLIVREKARGLKKKLHLNQVSVKNYWLSSLIIDSSLFFVTCLIIIIIGLIFHCDALYRIWSLVTLLVIIIIGSIASLLFQYVISLLFKSEMTASSFIPMINMGLLSVGYMIFFYLSKSLINMTPILSIGTTVFVLIYTILYPAISIVIAFNQVFILYFCNDLLGFDLSIKTYLNFKVGFLPIIIGLLISLFFYLILLLKLDKDESKKNEKIISRNKYNPNLQGKNETNERLLQENQDLYDELMSVKQDNKTMPISILHLEKEFIEDVNDKELKKTLNNKLSYKYGEIHRSLYHSKATLVKTIIEDVSFGVKEKECFGLLGPNGVGKSTLLNTIIGNYPLTNGNIYFNGIDSYKSDSSIGYCSQENVLWDKLNVIDHLVLFLRIRGVPKEKAKQYALQYCQYCQIEEYIDKAVMKLSGGTKRKVSLLLAVCGYPKQIILDEPTAGVDPATRLFVWDMIKEIRDTGCSSIILTTHSMEEAQELCNRLTILINGRLVCIGSPDYLRMKYSNSYILEVQTDQQEKIQELLFDKEKGAFSENQYKFETISTHRYKYQIELQKDLGKLFEILEKAKSNHDIVDYTLSQSTLEQVFIDFAKQFNND